jgi:hypothetical protein
VAKFDFGRDRVVSLWVAAWIGIALLPSPAARAQYASPSDDDVPFVMTGSLKVTSSSHRYHIIRARTEAGRHAAVTGPASPSNIRPAISVAPAASLPKPGFFPADLTNFGGGVIVQSDQVNIYYNCADSSCFGNPEQFQKDLAASKFIHILDQYVGSKKNNRYPLSKVPPQLLTGSTSLDFDGLGNLIHEAAIQPQIGTGHIFNVFLPQGVDYCEDTGFCYSPDDTSSFTFCSSHGFYDYDDLPNTIFYNVIPYQNVPECVVPAPNPNGPLADSTNSALLSEFFSTVTDPNVEFPSGWVADNSQLDAGNEISDLCTTPQFTEPSLVLVKPRSYQLGLEYSNFRHACLSTP